MSHKGQKRSERSNLRPWYCEAAGYRSSMSIPCICVPAAPHSATLQLVHNRKVRINGAIGVVLGYDGQCTYGTRMERTWLEVEEETQPDKNGETRKLLTRHIYPTHIREWVKAA